MNEEANASMDGREPRLDDRVLAVLAEGPGRIAFNGLKRALGAHPEALTRALRRLAREGLVEHSDHGYFLRNDSAPAGTGRARATDPEPLPPLESLATVRLSPSLRDPDVLGALAGRWFGELRWRGIYERPGDSLLVWSRVGDGAPVYLSVKNRLLRILVSDANNGGSDTRREELARDLLLHVLDRIRSLPQESGPRSITPLHLGFGSELREPN